MTNTATTATAHITDGIGRPIVPEQVFASMADAESEAAHMNTLTTLSLIGPFTARTA